MNFLITLRIALRALSKNKMRACLTVLGIVIGVFAVTVVVSIGLSATELVQGQLRGLGTNVLVVMPASARKGGVRQSTVNTLTDKDSKAIANECPAVLAASPLVSAAGNQVIYRNANCKPNELFGVGADYLLVRSWSLRLGDFFGEREINSRARVCVIGQSIVAKLFQTTNPLGQSIRIKNTPFTVIGVLESKGANLVGQDQDNVVLMPYTTVQKRLQGTAFSTVHAIMVSARTMDRMSEAEHQIRQLLRERHRVSPGERSDFMVQNTREIANVLGIITGTMTILLGGIAFVSLVVGGVGIMNIMLVSVTERTREIGVRMAMGARSWDILRQFLIESMLLSTLGGLVGIAMGIGTSVLAVKIINTISAGSDWPVVISLPAAAVAVVFSAGVGVFFGFFPALRASRLDPIEALRYE